VYDQIHDVLALWREPGVLAVALGGGWTTVAAELEFEAPVGVVCESVVRDCDLRVGEWAKAVESLNVSRPKQGKGQPCDRRWRLSGGEGRVQEPIGEVAER
jgi:hypothetical protein